MNDQTETQAPAQAGIEDFNGIFRERLRGWYGIRMGIRCFRGGGWVACPAKAHCRTRSFVKDIVAISGDLEGEKLDPLTSIPVEKQMVPP